MATLARLTGVAAAYFLAASLGSLFMMVPGMPSPVWPATGVALAAVLLLGARVWSALWLGAFFANIVQSATSGVASGQAAGAAFGIATGNTLQAVAAGWLIQRFANGRDCLEKPQTVFSFLLLAAFWSTLISATVGLTSLSLAGLRPQQFWMAWLTWWLGDAAGTILVAPLLLLIGNRRQWPVLRPPQIMEMAALLILLVVLCEIFFEGWLLGIRGARFSFLVIPILLWTAMRFGRRGVMGGCLILACFVIHGTFRGTGPFTGNDRNTSMLLAEAFISVIAVMGLMLAAGVVQRREAESGLRVSEQRYRELFESNPQPMWVYDYETLRFLAVNHSAVQHYGYSREEFLNMRITDLVVAEEPGAPASENGEETAVKPRHKRHRKKDGAIIEVEITRYNLLFDQRPAAMVTCSDITERIRAQEEIDRLNQDLERRVRDRTQQLEAINKELEAFCYSVSHDLRAPLRSIRGFSEVVLERYASHLDGRAQEFLRRACDSSQMMDRLIEDLLKLSRVTRTELQRQPVDLSSIADEIAADLRRNEPARRVEFVIARELRTEGDEHLLRVALDNLLRNAWKFTSKLAEARIEVGATPAPDEAFFVRDNGAGFDMAYANRLFSVFQRLHSAKEFAGTGVGLATVQRIINRHGGRAWATGEVNQGATFFFTLPKWN